MSAIDFLRPLSARRGLLMCAGVATTLLLAACSGGSGNDSDSGGSGSSTQTVSGKLAGADIQYPAGFAQSSASGVDYQKSTTGDSVIWSAKPRSYAYAKNLHRRQRQRFLRRR
jgi:hypothetical protein